MVPRFHVSMNNDPTVDNGCCYTKLDSGQKVLTRTRGTRLRVDPHVLRVP